MKAPALFVSHGSPMTALENGPYHEALRLDHIYEAIEMGNMSLRTFSLGAAA